MQSASKEGHKVEEVRQATWERQSIDRLKQLDARTRWSVSHILPTSLYFFVPPDPPEVEDPEGGASGTASESSTPESIVRMISSSGRGIGDRSGLSMAQFIDMVNNL